MASFVNGKRSHEISLLYARNAHLGYEDQRDTYGCGHRICGSHFLFYLEIKSVDLPPPLSRLQRYEFDDLLTVTADLDQRLRDLQGITSRMLAGTSSVVHAFGSGETHSIANSTQRRNYIDMQQSFPIH